MHRLLIVLALLAFQVFGLAGGVLAATYTVQKGDSLWAIGNRFGMTAYELQKANGLAYATILLPGQKLWVPDSQKFSTYELDLLARLVRAEAEGEPFAGQVAVASVVLNRLKDPRFPKTVHGVIYQYSGRVPQFSPVADGSINRPATTSTRKAVAQAIAGWDASKGAVGFYNPALVSWNNWVRKQRVTTVIQNHIFFITY